MDNNLTQDQMNKIIEDFKSIPEVIDCQVRKVEYILIRTESKPTSSFEDRKKIYDKEKEIMDKYPNISFDFEVD